MIKNLLAIFLLISTVPSMAQEPGWLYNHITGTSKTETGGYLEFSGSITAQTTTVPRSFFQPWLLGGNLDGIKDEVLGNLSNENSFGLWNFGRVDIMIPFKEKENGTKRGSLILGYQYSQIGGGIFRDKAFETLFYGNKEFGNNPVEISPFILETTKYSSLKIGYASPSLSWGITANLNNGHYFRNLEIIDARFQTDYYTDLPFLQAYELEVDGTVRQMTGQPEKATSTGSFGAGVDFFLNLPISKKTRVVFTIRDLGFIRWKNGLITDTIGTFAFSGIDISPENYHGSNIIGNLIDSIIPPGRKEGFSMVTPYSLSLRIVHDFTEKWQGNSSVGYLNHHSYAPLFQLGLLRKFSNWSAGATIRYGGWGKLHGGISLGLKLENWLFFGEIADGTGLVDKNGKGFSTNAGIAFHFN